MNFEWDLFQFTRADCLSLSQAVKAAPHLYHLHLHRSKLSDDSGRVLISHLLDHPGLRVLSESCLAALISCCWLATHFLALLL